MLYPRNTDTSALQLELSHIEGAIFDLNVQRSSILQQLNTCKSTVNRFPSEILVEVFLAAVQHDPWDSDALSQDEQTKWISPLLLGSEWLPRTGQSALSVIITPGNVSLDSWADSPPEEIISLVVPESYRWRHFDFFLFTSSHAQLSNISGHLPMLQSLAISSSALFDPQILQSLFSQVPVLRKIRLGKKAFVIVRRQLSQLTHVVLSSMTIDGCIYIIRQCPNLEHCSFLDTIDFQDINFPNQPIISPKLESLRVEFIRGVMGFDLLFRNISIPSARKLCDFDEKMLIGLLKSAAQLALLKFIKTSFSVSPSFTAFTITALFGLTLKIFYHALKESIILKVMKDVDLRACESHWPTITASGT
ncbi:hypothetical protein BDQ17DRAFT_1325205 [Cyathus striatus]|nr:hypothetical protein BDQ17DRAFT_1325205 [Cyathus striatus]